jgi:hypothetical protein
MTTRSTHAGISASSYDIAMISLFLGAFIGTIVVYGCATRAIVPALTVAMWLASMICVGVALLTFADQRPPLRARDPTGDVEDGTDRGGAADGGRKYASALYKRRLMVVTMFCVTWFALLMGASTIRPHAVA